MLYAQVCKMKPKDLGISWELLNSPSFHDPYSCSASLLNWASYLAIYFCALLSAQSLPFVLEPCLAEFESLTFLNSLWISPSFPTTQTHLFAFTASKVSLFLNRWHCVISDLRSTSPTSTNHVNNLSNITLHHFVKAVHYPMSEAYGFIPIVAFFCSVQLSQVNFSFQWLL